jgi:hypothetical protein
LKASHAYQKKLDRINMIDMIKKTRQAEGLLMLFCHPVNPENPV